MEVNHHGMTELFDQLGLPSDDVDIQEFINKHKGLTPETSLSDANFWSETQAKFLSEQIKIDADWAVIIDRLDCSLRT